MNRKQFESLAREGYNRIPVIREVLADTETPLSIYLKLGRGTHSYFFESVQGGEKWGRYSIIGLPCHTVIRVRGAVVTVETENEVIEEHQCEDPFKFVDDFKSRFVVAPTPADQRFTGGLVGYFSYDAVRYVETSLGAAKGSDDIGTPDILLMVSEEVVVFDNLRGTISFVIHVDPHKAAAFDSARTRLDELSSQLHKPVKFPTESDERTAPVDYQVHFAEKEFSAAVERIKEYIRAGDVMQVVLAQRMSTAFSGDPVNVYRALRFLNPSPYMVFFDLGDHHVVSASPEILARVENGRITVRPLAGTRKRGATEEEDQALESELLADEKELAEHLMLIDLSRNDSGRVSKTGSVSVPRKMFVERYSHVMHIVSEVEGRLAPGKDIWDLLMASFPAGTVSGAPKIRAMQLIHDLEPDARGPYSGVYGSVDLAGALNTAITIRTMVVKPRSGGGWTLQVQAGAGIVADSQPEAEFQETLNKARGMLTALACLEDFGA